MRPRDARYNAIALPAASNVDATVAYVATRSPVSNTFARYQNAEARKNDNRDETAARRSFAPGADDPQKATRRRFSGTGKSHALVPLLNVMQGALDDNVLPAVQEKFANTYRAAGGACDYRLFENSVHEWVAQPGPQTDKARDTVKDFIARQLKA